MSEAHASYQRHKCRVDIALISLISEEVVALASTVVLSDALRTLTGRDVEMIHGLPQRSRLNSQIPNPGVESTPTPTLL